MKIAIISDVHGNLEALKATLKDIERRNVDKIICLGDTIAKGVHPKECLALLKEKCAVMLQGNCDRFFSADYPTMDGISELDKQRILWNQSLVSAEERAYLANLPFSYEFYLSGSLVRLFHATPMADNVAVLNVDDFETKFKMFCPTEKTMSQEIADIVVYGHIHHQYQDKIYNRTLINVGSVGNSFDTVRNPEKDANVLETTCAMYCILEGELGVREYTSAISSQFIKVPYDIEKELMDEERNIERDGYRYEIERGMYRDMTKINNNFRKLGIDVDKI